jgi:hypothetical protein
MRIRCFADLDFDGWASHFSSETLVGTALTVAPAYKDMLWTTDLTRIIEH